MTYLTSFPWRGAVASVLLGLSACGGSDVAAADETKVEGLVSSESQLACTTCGTARYSDIQGGFGWTCSEARAAAVGYINQDMQWQCPAGSCNVVWSYGRCTPVGPNRTDGFEMNVSVTYSCCQ
ncbi:hypothetical protein ACLESD_17185 [Pyxidicoccus sp. 3LFB2]